MANVFRCYTEKREGFDVEARALLKDLTGTLGISHLTGVRLIHRYDAEGIDEATYAAARTSVFSEPQCDLCYDEELPALEDGTTLLAVESLPGQYDQRADSCAQCIQMITCGERPLIRTARIYALQGDLTDEDLQKIKNDLINPVEAREASLDKPETLRQEHPVPPDVAVLDGFTAMGEDELPAIHETYGLAMDMEDLHVFQDHFKSIGRDPTVTELKLIDTYWSDHCRHTTFSTHIDQVDIQDYEVHKAYERYLAAREEVYGPEKAAARAQDADGSGHPGHQGAQKARPASHARRERGDQRLLGTYSSHHRRPGAGLAADVQKRDPQPSHGDRTLRRRSHLHRRRHPRPAVRPFLCLSGPCASPAPATPPCR